MTNHKYVPISYLQQTTLVPVTLKEAIVAAVEGGADGAFDRSPVSLTQDVPALETKVRQLTEVLAAVTAVLAPSQQDLIASNFHLFPVSIFSTCVKSVHKEGGSMHLLENDFREKDYLFLERAKQRYIRYMRKYPQVAQEVWLALDLADRPGPSNQLNEEPCTPSSQNMRLLHWVRGMLGDAYCLVDWWARHLPHAGQKERKLLLAQNRSARSRAMSAIDNKLYATRLAWLDWMIQYCKERDL
jgi:hypothetical protein